jgi:hypothetical protein
MALSFDWLGIADGSTNDSNGALTLVAVGHNMMIARSFPHREQRVLVVSILDEDGTTLSQNESASFDIQITSPSNRILLANHQMLRLDEVSRGIVIPPEIPGRGFQIVMGVVMEVSEFGPHVIRVIVDVGDEHLERTRTVYVIRPPDIPR